MSYLDDLVNGADAASGTGADGSAPSLVQTVRDQLEEGQFDAYQITDTQYKVTDIGFAVGFAEGVITLDEESGTCIFDIDTHIPVPADRHKAFDRFCRHVNGTFITRGFVLADGTLHFASEIPVNVRQGENDSSEFSRAMSSIHRHAEDFSLMLAGVDPWEIIEASKKKAREDAIRSILEDLD